MTFEIAPVPHVDFEQGSFFLMELLANGLLYLLVIAVVGGLALLARDLR